MRFQCDTSLWVNVAVLVFSHSLQCWFFQSPLSPSPHQSDPIRSHPIHFHYICNHFGSICWFIQSQYIVCWDLLSECIRILFSAQTIWSFDSMQNTFRFISIHTKARGKKWNISIDKLFTWWNILRHDTIRLFCIHFGWLCVHLHSVHFSMVYGKIEFWTFICMANKNYDLSKHKRMWLSTRKKTMTRGRERESVPQVKDRTKEKRKRECIQNLSINCEVHHFPWAPFAIGSALEHKTM